MPSPWTIKKEIEMIEFFSGRPSLYDTANRDYYRKDLRSEYLTELGQSINFTVKEIKEKWKKIRNYYVKEKKKIMARSGAGLDDCYTSRWLHFDRLAFLSDSIKPRLSDDASLDVSAQEFHETASPLSHDMDDYNQSELLDDYVNGEPVTEIEVLPEAKPSTIHENNQTFKRKRKMFTPDIIEDRCLDEEDNAARSFLNFVYHEMKKMPEENLMHFQLDVHRLLFDYRNKEMPNECQG